MTEPVTYVDFAYDEDRHALTIASSIDRFDEDQSIYISCVTFLVQSSKFGIRVLNGIRARSVASNAGFLWVIGVGGEIWTYTGTSKTPIEGTLPDSGVRAKRHLGRPEKLRVIGGTPYVCGFAGQVYTLAAGNWVHMDDGIVEPEGKVDSPAALEGIHGTGPNDIYVVGSGGFLAHWDGRSWTRVRLPIDGYLAGVRALSTDHIVAVGDNGTFAEKRGASWTTAQIPGYEKTLLSDVECFNGDLYVAAVGRLLVRKASGWTAVRTGLKQRPEFIRLTVGDGRLWAMGSKRIHSFDGHTWTAHVDPDNG